MSFISDKKVSMIQVAGLPAVHYPTAGMYTYYNVSLLEPTKRYLITISTERSETGELIDADVFLGVSKSFSFINLVERGLCSMLKLEIVLNF